MARTVRNADGKHIKPASGTNSSTNSRVAIQRVYKRSLIFPQPSGLWSPFFSLSFFLFFFHGPLDEAISGRVCVHCAPCLYTCLAAGRMYTYIYIYISTREAYFNNLCVATKATTYLQIRRRKVVLERTLEACQVFTGGVFKSAAHI